MDDQEYAKRVLPSICKLLGANDRSIRRSLLENIDTYGDKFDAATIEEKVCISVCAAALTLQSVARQRPDCQGPSIRVRKNHETDRFDHGLCRRGLQDARAMQQTSEPL
jgi:hypothetical protein